MLNLNRKLFDLLLTINILLFQNRGWSTFKISLKHLFIIQRQLIHRPLGVLILNIRQNNF